MVEGIEHLEPELQPDSLRDLSVLEDAKVEMVQSRSALAIACDIAERISKARCGG